MSKQLHNGYLHNGFMISPFSRKYPDRKQMSSVYFSLLSAFNNLELTKGEVNLLSHISLHGGVVSGSSKGDYIAKYQTSMATVDNMVSRLKKKKLLLKVDEKVRLHPRLNIDFTNNDNFIFSFKCQMSSSI